MIFGLRLHLDLFKRNGLLMQNDTGHLNRSELL